MHPSSWPLPERTGVTQVCPDTKAKHPPRWPVQAAACLDVRCTAVVCRRTGSDLPRAKTCGGGTSSTSLGALPANHSVSLGASLPGRHDHRAAKLSTARLHSPLGIQSMPLLHTALTSCKIHITSATEHPGTGTITPNPIQVQCLDSSNKQPAQR